MRSELRAALLGVLASAMPLLAQPTSTTSAAPVLPQRDSIVAIEHVTIIDPASDGDLRDHTVIIRGRSIVTIGPSAGPKAVRVPLGSRRLDGRGRWLLPGLWDAHAHVFSRRLGTAYLAHGITSLRDMGDAAGPLRLWRAGFLADSVAGPRLLFPGAILDGVKPLPFQQGYFRQVGDSSSAGRLVDSLVDRGADFVKVYTQLSDAQLRWILQAASRRNVPVMGHVPFASDAGTVALLGMRSQEHLYGLLHAGSSSADRLRSELLADSLRAIPGAPYRRAFEQTRELLATQRKALRDTLIRRLLQSGTYIVPTLVAFEPYHRLDDSAFTGAADLRLIPAVLRSAFTSVAVLHDAGRGLDVPMEHRLWQSSLGLVRELSRAGVPIVAGSDAPNPFTAPGVSLHRELELLAASGLSPREVLRSATVVPAHMMGKGHLLGRVQVGFLADLIMLDADPLYRISNTRRITTVIIDGRVYDREAVIRLQRDALAEADGYTRYGLLDDGRHVRLAQVRSSHR